MSRPPTSTPWATPSSAAGARILREEPATLDAVPVMTIDQMAVALGVDAGSAPSRPHGAARSAGVAPVVTTSLRSGVGAVAERDDAVGDATEVGTPPLDARASTAPDLAGRRRDAPGAHDRPRDLAAGRRGHGWTGAAARPRWRRVAEVGSAVVAVVAVVGGLAAGSTFRPGRSDAQPAVEHRAIAVEVVDAAGWGLAAGGHALSVATAAEVDAASQADSVAVSVVDRPGTTSAARSSPSLGRASVLGAVAVAPLADVAAVVVADATAAADRPAPA